MISRLAVCLSLSGFALMLAAPALPADLDAVREAEKQRMAVIEKVRPAVVALFAPAGNNGGSGVLIDPQGYLLTNYHVVNATGPTMKCGLPDGKLYDGVVVGIDKVGDVALVKLLPREEGKPFPFAPLGDSDKVRAGDWSVAMGNPFLLATDFTPTVTFGLVSGTNRYQPPDSGGGLLEYTDCIQIDTSINPGNSGGPLFNMAGELIGINGRGSFDKRSRINSGVGYAISINQIKNFYGHLLAGIEVDHATLGAVVASSSSEAVGDIARILVTDVLDTADVARRGVQTDDELVSFAGRPVNSVNQYKNVVGIYPKGWRLPLTFRRGGGKKVDILVRLEGLQAKEIKQPGAQPMPPRPAPKGPNQPAATPSPAAKFFKPKPDFTNYYFNEQALAKLADARKPLGDFAPLTGPWKIEGTFSQAKRDAPFVVTVADVKDEGGTNPTKPVVSVELNAKYVVEPLKKDLSELDLLDPPNSGGLAVALYQYRRLLTLGDKGFEGTTGFAHGGVEPVYIYPAGGPVPTNPKDAVMCEVVRTSHVSVPAKWYFFRKALNPAMQTPPWPDGALIYFEVSPMQYADPCEVYLTDYKPVNGRQVAHVMDVRHADKPFAVLNAKAIEMDEGKK